MKYYFTEKYGSYEKGDIVEVKKPNGLILKLAQKGILKRKYKKRKNDKS